MKTLQTLAFLSLLSYMAYGQSLEPQIIKEDLSGANAIVYSDFNDDGVKEYIVARPSEDVVTMVYEAGTELIEKDLLVIDGPSDFALEDFDNDGRVDIAISAFNSSGIRILRNIGELEFSVHTLNSDDYENAASIAASDIDLDGDMDLIISSTSRADIAVFEMIDPSSFSFDIKIIDNAVDIKDVNIADLDNDGLPDIVGSNFFLNELNIFFNQGGLNFQKSDYLVSGSIQNSIADFNNDGFLDIGITSYSDSDLFVFLNNGNRTFEERFIDGAVSNAISISCFDINHDDISDVVVGTDEGIVVFLMENIDNNKHTREDYYYDGRIGPFDIVDVDSDGDMDVVASSTAIPGIIHYINLTNISAVQDLGINSINVYPNPANDFISIGKNRKSDYKISLYNFEGKLLKETLNSNHLSLETISPGLYLMEINDPKTGVSIIEKIVIAR